MSLHTILLVHHLPSELIVGFTVKFFFLVNSNTVESPNKGHFGTNINSSGLSTI